MKIGTKLLLGICAGLVIAGLFIGYSVGTKKSANALAESQAVVEGQKILTSELRQAGLKQTAKIADLQDYVTQLKSGFDAQSQRLIDSMKQYIVSASSGEGNVNISNTGFALHGKYQDPWIHAMITGDTSNPQLSYGFNFKVRDVEFITEDKQNVRREIYSVYLQSTYDTSKTYFLGDYSKQFVTLPPKPKIIEKGFSYNPSVMFGSSYSFKERTTLIAAGISFFEYSADKSTIKGTIWKLPIIGVASDLSQKIEPMALVGLNIGHWIPIFEDLYIAGGIGYNLEVDQKEYHAGISTTL